MDKITKIFKVNSEIRSYTYPAIKISLCLVVILVLMNRNRLFSLEDKRGAIATTVLALVLAMGCVFCIYIAIAEIVELHDRRVDNQGIVGEVVIKQYPTENLMKLIEKEDILEVEIKVQEEIVKIGCKSDNKWSTNDFFDKVYYCDDAEYETIEAFREVLNAYEIDGMLEVVSIDGIMQ